MSFQIGSGYSGSDSLQTSVALQEILPMPKKIYYKLALSNKTDCVIIINNTTRIFLEENQGFVMGVNDCPITSIKIEESGVIFNWIAAHY